METRQVLVVDAFAAEPLAGVPIAVLPDGADLTDRQHRAVADELGTNGTVSYDESLQYVERDRSQSVVSAAVAGCTSLLERGILEPGTHELTAGSDEYTIEVNTDQSASLGIPTLSVEQPEVTSDEIALALGIDVETLRDVGADLPIGRTDRYGGSLFVPVNFLQHLGNAIPDDTELAALLDDAGADRLFAFTFDSLGHDADVHARVFTREGELAASGVATAGCGAYLTAYGAFDEDREQVRVESGHFLDRPSTLGTTLDSRPRVSGSALTTVDGSITIPADDTDEIIEV